MSVETLAAAAELRKEHGAAGVEAPKVEPIVCPECFGNPEIDPADAPGHLIQHWPVEPDAVKSPEGYRRYHNFRDQILARGGVV